ncbi:MAG: O-methyltransferase [Balneolaceae bacterium]
MDFIDTRLSGYCDDHTSQESETVMELIRVTEKELQYSEMICGRQIGQLLRLLIQISGARRILEIGTFTGYSAMMMAEVLPDDGEIVTLEMNERYRDLSRPFFEKEPYRQKIRQVMGDALITMDAIHGQFDFVFLDADKVFYPDYYRKFKPKMKPGGLLVVDNTLWSGEVLSIREPKSRAIDQLNGIIQNDPDMQNVMLPVRDGILIARYHPSG